MVRFSELIDKGRTLRHRSNNSLPLAALSLLASFAFSVVQARSEVPAQFVDGVVIYYNLQDMKIESFSNVLFHRMQFAQDNKPESPSETADLRQRAQTILEERLKLVTRTEKPQYQVDVALIEQTIYAVRNPEGKPATGFLMASLCKFPIANDAEDCGQQYIYFFENDGIFSSATRRNLLFDWILRRWITRVVIN
jgi:hypothetical protein